MKRAFIVAAAIGLALALAIIGYEGFGAVVTAFAAVGLGLIIVVVLRAVQLAGAGAAWWLIFPRGVAISLQLCIWVRFIREAINSLLPVAQIGGEVAGGRLITFFGVSAPMAGATVLVDILMQVVGLFLFVIAGVGVLAVEGADDAVLRSLLAGLAFMGAALIGFFAVQRFGGVRLVDRALMALAGKLGWSSLANVASLHDDLMRIYADAPRLAAALLVHLAVWFVGVLEVTVALHFMGYPASYGEALVIESLGQAARAGAFLVPGALGVQEAGFVAICAIYGIPAADALALSLVKRVPEIVLGLPFLVAWHAHESRALIGRGPAAP
jgi:putative membrane protein